MINRLLLFATITSCMLGCAKEKTKGAEQEPKTPQINIVAYDEAVLADKPVGYWLLNKTNLNDASTAKHHGTWKGTQQTSTKLPNGEDSFYFNGTDNYYEIPDADHLEVSEKGILTIEAWMSPAVLDFPNLEPGKDYIHWMGKGTTNQYSWVARMYNKDSFRENRPQRISGYSFNLAGGLGAGSYFQDVIAVGTWIHYTLVINTKDVTATYPSGYTKLYRDGKLRDQDDLAGYEIIPKNGIAPTRIGTRDFASFFKGSIAKVAIYDYELSADKIAKHFNAMK